jgi:hypothetical protein
MGAEVFRRWDRDSADPAYLGGKEFAYWLVVLANVDDLRAAVPRLREFDEHGADHLRMVRNELERREKSNPGGGE